MKTHVVKTTPEASLAEVVDLMDIYQVNSLPVIDSQGCLCGLIAEQDICRAVSEQWSSLRDANDCDATPAVPPACFAVSTTTAAQVMQPATVVISENADVASVLRMFFVNDFTRLPVIDADGDVVGTLNRIDILQAIFERTFTGPGE